MNEHRSTIGISFRPHGRPGIVGRPFRSAEFPMIVPTKKETTMHTSHLTSHTPAPLVSNHPTPRPARARRAVFAASSFCAALLVFTASVHAAAPGSADAKLPFVYAKENMGTKFSAPPLPELGKAPYIEPLPDPFAWAKSPLGKSRSEKFSDWEHHRAEIIAQIEHYEIGTKPPRPAKETATYSNNVLTVTVTVGTNTLKLTSRIILPTTGQGPFAAIIGMNSQSGSVPAYVLNDVAKVQFSANQVTRYGSAPSANDPYYQLYPELLGQSGQYSAWSWGVSRIIDGLELVQKDLPIDLKHIGVTGCSYAGKMALFAGALDERVALTIAQESGGGGDTTWRYSAIVDAAAKTQNERVEGLAQTDKKWFRPQMFQFGGTNVSYLPEDHHMLEALVAPRALLATGNTNYIWLSNPSAYICNRATEKVYDTLGISDRFGFDLLGGHQHCATLPVIDQEMKAFIDKFLLSKADVNTHIRDYPEDFNNIDAAKWTAWWGTGKPQFPPAK